MPSIIASAAAGLVALSGVATAFPQGGFSNTTLGGGAHALNSSKPLTESDFCPSKSGGVFYGAGARFAYTLECSTNHFGTTLEIAFNATIFAPFAKRQVAYQPGSIGDCLNLCDTVDNCVATAFNVNERSCTLFGGEIGAAYTEDGVDFAYRVQVPGQSVPAGGSVPTTVYEPTVVTVNSCAPTVTNCPLRGNAVVTQMIPVTSTDYICPTATVLPAAPLACSCAYSASTATVYSTTTAGGAVTVVPVGTAVIAKAMPSGTAVATTAAVMAGANAGAAQATAAVPAANGNMFTGSASSVQAAGLGLVAGIAGLALML